MRKLAYLLLWLCCAPALASVVLLFQPASVSVAYYVAPAGSGGSDSNPGTLASPFLTLAHAKSMMEASSSNPQTTYVRAGTYSSTSLTLGSADNGQVWSQYVPDGYNTAILDGGASSPTTGGNVINLDGASNVTINGFTIQNCKNWGVGIHGGNADSTGGWASNVASTSGNTISNNIITTCYTELNNNWAGGGIWVDGNNTNVTISNNVITNQYGSAIRTVTTAGSNNPPFTSYKYSGMTITGNVIYLVNEYTGDNGAIYFEDLNDGLSTGITVSNNFLRDFQENPSTQKNTTSLPVNPAVYCDSGASNTTVSGNVIADSANAHLLTSSTGTLDYAFNGGGHNNTWTGNVFDLGNTADSGAKSYALAYDDQFSNATGNVLTQNIFIGNWSGAQQSSGFGTGPATYFYNAGSYPSTHYPAISNNLYYNYGGGTLGGSSNQGTIGPDSSPVTGTDPSFNASNYLYQLNVGSPAYGSPLNFSAIAGGWGPPGYVIPSGTSPSY